MIFKSGVIFMDMQNEGKDTVKTDVSDQENSNQGLMPAPSTWLEVLPSSCGTLLTAVLANVMTEGLNSTQENVLGNFLAAVAAQILYKASGMCWMKDSSLSV